MLEQYFLKPETVDQIRSSWLAEPIERYVTSLSSQGYPPSYIRPRVPILRQFAQFAWSRGARTFEELPEHVEPFVAHRTAGREAGRSAARARRRRQRTRGPVEQLVALVVASFVRRSRARITRDPFLTETPGFFTYLREERGLRETSIPNYGHYLRIFEAFLIRIGVQRLAELSPAILSAFVTEAGSGMSKPSMTGMCGAVRVLMRYAHREGAIARDLSRAVEAPRMYRLSSVPRSISSDDVRLMLESVDRRGALGTRDFAMLLLLVTYGLRAREVAALTLDDIDWERERLFVPERKAEHCTAYPLSGVVGEAVLDYLRNARPSTQQRQVFLRAVAPRVPVASAVVANRAAYYLRKAGIRVRRPGSHTLRHYIDSMTMSGRRIRTFSTRTAIAVQNCHPARRARHSPSDDIVAQHMRTDLLGVQRRSACGGFRCTTLDQLTNAGAGDRASETIEEDRRSGVASRHQVGERLRGFPQERTQACLPALAQQR